MAYCYRLTIDNMSSKDTLPVLIAEYIDSNDAVVAAHRAAEDYWKEKRKNSLDWGFIPGRAKWIVWDCQGYELTIFYATVHKQSITVLDNGRT